MSDYDDYQQVAEAIRLLHFRLRGNVFIGINIDNYYFDGDWFYVNKCTYDIFCGICDKSIGTSILSLRNHAIVHLKEHNLISFI